GKSASVAPGRGSGVVNTWRRGRRNRHRGWRDEMVGASPASPRLAPEHTPTDSTVDNLSPTQTVCNRTLPTDTVPEQPVRAHDPPHTTKGHTHRCHLSLPHACQPLPAPAPSSNHRPEPDEAIKLFRRHFLNRTDKVAFKPAWEGKTACPAQGGDNLDALLTA